MYNLNKNNYHLKPKDSNIQTPKEVSEFIFELLKDKIAKKGVILDPCSGQGSLLDPWKENEFWTYGIDVAKNSSVNLVRNFLNWDGVCSSFYSNEVRLILCNPPFNGMKPKLAPEIWLDKIIELFGKEVPIVLFAPVGFCANLTLKSKRLEKFNNGTYPPIVSRITLPKNIFPGVVFHSEILIFNIQGLEPHYFYQPHE